MSGLAAMRIEPAPASEGRAATCPASVPLNIGDAVKAILPTFRPAAWFCRAAGRVFFCGGEA